jgi:PhnB protein
MDIVPYLFFDGRAEQALAFYRQALGAQCEAIHRFKDSPNSEQIPPGAGDKVMHVTFTVGDTTIMASDGHCHGTPTFQGFSLSLNVRTEAEAERYFAALSDGGKVEMPLTKTFFSPRFGMVTDRFGISWMVHVRP